MIIGAHVVVFTRALEPTRDFLRDVLKLSAVDAGGGWLIFALPPAEVAVHPAQQASQELYLMCDDLAATIVRLTRAGATFGPVRDERWGSVSTMTMPGGAQLPIYQPSHPSPILPRIGRQDESQAVKRGISPSPLPSAARSPPMRNRIPS